MKTLKGPNPTDLVISGSQSPETPSHDRIEVVFPRKLAVTISLYPSLSASPMKTLKGPNPTDLVISGSQSPETPSHDRIETVLSK